MKISKERLKQLVQEELAIGINVPGEDEMVDGKRTRDPDGYEGRMAKQNLWKMANYAKELHDLIDDDENLEPWVEEKIAVASFMMDSVAHYMEYEKERAGESMEGEAGHVDFPGEESPEHEAGEMEEPEEYSDGEEEYEFDLEPEESEEEYEDEEGEEDEGEREEL